MKHRHNRSLLSAVFIGSLAVLLAACGGGTGNTTAPSPSNSATTAPTAANSPAYSSARPNILVIEADDMRTDDLRWMPNVRRLIGGAGLTFANSFAPYPLCCPSRASFLTGKYAHNHHVLSHIRPFGFRVFDDHLTVATQLQDSGYQTALVGKYLNGYGQMTTREGRPSLLYVPPGWTQWYAGSDHIWKPGQAFSGGTYAYFDLTQNINGKLVNSSPRYSTTVLANQTGDLISSFSRKQAPWFIWWTPVAPHHGGPHEADDPGRTVRSDGVVTRWKTPARPDWVKGHFDAQITHGLGTPLVGSAEADVSDKPQWIRSLPELNGQEKKDETNLTRQRAESLFVLDREVGKTLQRLRHTGEYDHTVIAFTSDNGYYLGEHRKRQGKIQLHEPSLRVPFLIAGPGVPHGVRYDPISTVDLAPTFSAYAGLGSMPGADGINMVPVITGGDRGWTRPVVMEGLMGGIPQTAPALGFPTRLNNRGLRLGRWKLMEYSTGEKELYDLQTDPLELQSLDKDPRYAGRLAEMERVWRAYKDCAGAACSRPLPENLQVSAAQNRKITRAEQIRTRAYYGD